jgi:predicted nucleotidyltransferase
MFIMEQLCLFNQSVWNVFEVFSNEPLKIHFIKEISRKINLAPTSVRKHLETLEKQNILLKKQGDRFKGYIANRDSEEFLFSKKVLNIYKIYQSRLVDYIYDVCVPNSIILFGSFSIGEDIEKSDIDIFVESKEKKLDLSKFKKILNKEINLFFNPDINKLNNELKNNILNGTVLKGFLRVFK